MRARENRAMKKPQFNITLPDDIRKDLMILSLEQGVSAAQFIRDVLSAELSRRTGKTYTAIHHGGDRRSRAAAPSVPSAASKPRSRARSAA